MSSFISYAISKLLIFSLVIAILHLSLVEFVLPEIYGAGAYWAIYLFLVPMSLITVLMCYVRYRSDNTSVGTMYFIFVFIKMFGSVIFLWPWLFPKNDFSLPFVHQFFGLFFPLLFVEIGVLVRLLNPPSDEILKNDVNQTTIL